MGLCDLPPEIIGHIVLHIPTANGVTRLAQTCRRMHAIISTHEARIFRCFVQARFPKVKTPPFWKDAVCALTSRSRAIDRLGVIARVVIEPEAIPRIGLPESNRRDNPTMSYCPPIDSYEIWTGQTWSDRKEVLAWGAGEKLLIRTRHFGNRVRDEWLSFNGVDGPNSYDDISGLHLLKANHGKAHDIENVIFGRRRGEIRHIALSTGDGSYEYKKQFQTKGLQLDEMDLMPDSNPILCAHFHQGSTALYFTGTDDENVQPFAWLHPQKPSRCLKTKLLSSSRIAVANSNVKGSLVISRISPAGIIPEHTVGVDAYPCQTAAAIEPLANHILAGSPGDVFLAAWADSTVRLHDLRSPRSYEASYEDFLDDTIIYSVRALGQDRFMVGSGMNGVVKLFDLRCTTYSYLDARGPQPRAPSKAPIAHNHEQYPSKDFSMYLSQRLPPHRNIRRNIRAQSRPIFYPYNGPIYSMSMPSPSSPTVYCGLTGGLVQLDFASTDDLTGPAKRWHIDNLNLDLEAAMDSPNVSGLFPVTGFERPGVLEETTTSKLRKQHGSWDPRVDADLQGAVSGWDQRWKPLEEPGAWRRRDH